MGLEPEIAAQAWKDFTAHCWKNGEIFCVRCKSKKYYKLAGNKYRCKKCKYTFHDFSGRWLSKIDINLRKWAVVLRSFCVNNTASQTAQELKISYPTTYKAFNVIRLAIAQQSPDWQMLKGTLPFSESKKSILQQTPVFGIIESRGKVSTFFLPNFSIKALSKSRVKIFQSNQIFYTDRLEKYDYLLFYMSKNRMIFSRKNIEQGPRQSEFLDYLVKELRKHYGISDDKFPLYLKEMEFRFNRKPPSHLDWFDLIRYQNWRKLFRRLLIYITKFADC